MLHWIDRLAEQLANGEPVGQLWQQYLQHRQRDMEQERFRALTADQALIVYLCDHADREYAATQLEANGWVDGAGRFTVEASKLYWGAIEIMEQASR